MLRAPILLALALPLCLLPLTARAQELTPAFNLPQIITVGEVEDLSMNFDDAFSMIENDYLADTMMLQYQISLLEKMVMRQAELKKISDAYATMGIAFNEPAPPRGICAQLPSNAPCLASYPELYSDLVKSRKEHYAEMAAKARAATVLDDGPRSGETEAEMQARVAAAEEKRRAEEAKREREGRFRWTEVSCVANQCRGVLTGAAGYRATVRDGSRLADGTLVQDVSADGIRVSIDGHSIAVRPAPGEGGSAPEQTASLAPSLASALENAGVSDGLGFSEVPASDAQQASAASIAGGSANAPGGMPPASGVTAAADDAIPPPPGGGTSGRMVAEPALGPSGLF